MSKTFKFDPKNTDQQNNKKSKQAEKMLGRSTKNFLRNLKAID
jgi:hypothetical protein